MKVKISALFLAAAMAASGLAIAGPDDKKWIDQCVKDNKDEGAKSGVVKKYCECMNNEMSENETKSISQWEKTHPKEMKKCEKESGWK